MSNDGDQPGPTPEVAVAPSGGTPSGRGRRASRRGGRRGGPPWADGSGPPWKGGGGPPWKDGAPWRDGAPWAGRPGRPTRHGTVFLTIFVFCVEFWGTRATAHHQTGARMLDALGYWLIVVGVVALLFRVRARVPAYVVTLASSVLYVLFGYPYGPVFFALLVSIFGAVRTGHGRAVWWTTLFGYMICVALPRLVHSVGGARLHAPSVFTSIFVGAWVLVAMVVANGLRLSAAQIAAANRSRAEQARARAEQERRQASDERLRIARELHDVLGHHLTLINVRAGVGLHLMDEDPAQARVALETIKHASSEALGEVRAVLDMLRAADDEAPPRNPAPGLADLRSLVDGADTTVVGDTVSLPPEVDRAAYRIIQESLTNVRRHAGHDAHANVTLTYRQDKLVVRIADDGAGAPDWSDAESDGSDPPDDADGNGIAGMRARAQALGGTLAAGPGITKGFVVTATLPLTARSEDRS